jgi:hypothetical protein
LRDLRSVDGIHHASLGKDVASCGYDCRNSRRNDNEPAARHGQHGISPGCSVAVGDSRLLKKFSQSVPAVSEIVRPQRDLIASANNVPDSENKIRRWPAADIKL